MHSAERPGHLPGAREVHPRSADSAARSRSRRSVPRRSRRSRARRHGTACREQPWLRQGQQGEFGSSGTSSISTETAGKGKETGASRRVRNPRRFQSGGNSTCVWVRIHRHAAHSHLSEADRHAGTGCANGVSWTCRGDESTGAGQRSCEMADRFRGVSIGIPQRRGCCRWRHRWRG